jgi:hypothetical protein
VVLNLSGTLPKTSDGVEILPGMIVYFPSGVDAAVLAVWFDGTLELQSHDADGIPVTTWKMLGYTSGAYSTKAAAEASR